MPLTLRDYQEECVQAHFDFFDRHRAPEENPLFVVPTGGGKSLVIAEFIARSRRLWPQTRFLVLTHVRELIRQNHDEFVSHIGRPLQQVAGIYSAGLARRDLHCPVLFAGIQSIWERADELGPFDLVLVDEAHLIPKRGQGRYRSYLAALRKINPRVRVLGYTATHYRLDGGYLHRGADRLFTHVAYDVRIELLVQRGFLAPLVARLPEKPVDVSGVKISSTGDYAADELEAAMREDGCVEAACEETVRLAAQQGRTSWLIFASGKLHAADIVEELGRRGVAAVAVFGDTPKKDRDDVVQRFRAGQLRALVNVGVLTTGFNAPRIDLMAIMRPTQSASLYVQMMGRGMRTFAGKKDCLVLDYGGNVERHGPINAVRPRGAGPDGEVDKGPAPTKVCPVCRTIVGLGTPICGTCLYEWPAAMMQVEHARVASHLCPLDLEAGKPRVLPVTGWFFRLHEKEGRPPSMRIDLMAGMKCVQDWLCFEHEGFPGRKAKRWWRLLGGLEPAPDKSSDAVARAPAELRQPAAVEVVDDGEYLRVHRFLGVPPRDGVAVPEQDPAKVLGSGSPPAMPKQVLP